MLKITVWIEVNFIALFDPVNGNLHPTLTLVAFRAKSLHRLFDSLVPRAPQVGGTALPEEGCPCPEAVSNRARVRAPHPTL